MKKMLLSIISLLLVVGCVSVEFPSDLEKGLIIIPIVNSSGLSSTTDYYHLIIKDYETDEVVIKERIYIKNNYIMIEDIDEGKYYIDSFSRQYLTVLEFNNIGNKMGTKSYTKEVVGENLIFTVTKGKLSILSSYLEVRNSFQEDRYDINGNPYAQVDVNDSLYFVNAEPIDEDIKDNIYSSLISQYPEEFALWDY